MTEQNMEQMDINVIKEKAEQGDVEAQYELGYRYVMGKGVQKDSQEGGKWLHLAAKNGHGEAQCSIAIMCDAGAGKEDAVYWYTRAVEGGKITSQEYLFDAYSYLLDAYYYKDGVQKDIKKALKWAQLAAEKGYKLAEYILAAEQGDINEQRRLGFMYYVGEGATEDIEKARYWWELASKQGDARSQVFLAEKCYGNDKQKALELLQSAANTGDGYSQYRLGDFYFENKNHEQAYNGLV